MSAARSAPPEQKTGEAVEEQRVTPLKLFFDLVFAFAQVTALLSSDATWTGLLRGAAMLAALWWAWVCYSWLSNAIPAEERTRTVSSPTL